MILFHRFYMRHSFARHDRWRVATACAFLGFKVEEMHQKVRHVVNASWDAYYRGTKPRPDERSAEFAALRQQVLDTERCVLYTLQFDISIDFPYGTIRDTLRMWREEGLFGAAWPRGALGAQAPSEIVALNNTAINIAYEACATTLCLLYTPHELGIAALKLALDVTYTLKGRACPIPWAVLSRSIDLHTLRALVTGWEAALAETGGSEPDMKATEGMSAEELRAFGAARVAAAAAGGMGGGGGGAGAGGGMPALAFTPTALPRLGSLGLEAISPSPMLPWPPASPAVAAARAGGGAGAAAATSAATATAAVAVAVAALMPALMLPPAPTPSPAPMPAPAPGAGGGGSGEWQLPALQLGSAADEDGRMT